MLLLCRLWQKASKLTMNAISRSPFLATLRQQLFVGSAYNNVHLTHEKVTDARNYS
jgi:hypothetical protein